jgi:hypothetical protein
MDIKTGWNGWQQHHLVDGLTKRSASKVIGKEITKKGNVTPNERARRDGSDGARFPKRK